MRIVCAFGLLLIWHKSGWAVVPLACAAALLPTCHVGCKTFIQEESGREEVMGRNFRNIALAAVTFVMLAALLTSCSSSGEPTDPLADYKSQTLAWQTCGAEIKQVLGPQVTAAMELLGSRAKCAFMRAPLDYADRSKGDLQIALLRVGAEGPQQRLGAILFNPGGPGNDGLPGAIMFGSRWTGADPADPVASLYKQMSQSYDLVGFSPRGTGASTNLVCRSDLFFRFVTSSAVDSSDENYANILYNSRLIADTCKQNPMTPYINSETTARDMDLMRHLLGDSKLNYIGYSYGTWLGTWYAGLFPERVGRMLLVGMVDITQPLGDVMFLPQEMSMQRVIDEVLVPYAVRHPDRFGLGRTELEVRQAYLSLRTAPGYLLSAVTALLPISVSGEADTTLLYLRAAQRMQEYLKANPAADETAVTKWIGGADFVSDPARNENTRELARQLNTQYFSKVRKEVESAELTGKNALAFTIAGNDSGSNFGVDEWVRASRSSSALYSLYGGFWAQNPCIYWGGATVTRPSASAMAGAGKIMMLQSEQDPWTPREGALKSLAVLPNAGMVLVRNEYSHGLYPPYGTECIDRPVAEYFLYGKAPERLTICDGKALAADR